MQKDKEKFFQSHLNHYRKLNVKDLRRIQEILCAQERAAFDQKQFELIDRLGIRFKAIVQAILEKD